jgi:serine/threonine protein kinase
MYLFNLGGPDPVERLGALKQFKITPNDKDEEAKAIGRLESEVRALEKVKHRAVLRLLHANVDERFIVTEYHLHGTLAQNLNRYKGNTLAALEAFRWMVDGVHEIHKQGAIHRDIKPENIFVADSGDLVLGDFGIVFFQDGERLTTTYERVGSHFWMAAWAYYNARLELDKVNPKLDIYPLGKVLWSMISGRNGFPYWEYAEPDNNLEKLFPNDSIMPLVNELFAKCVVRHEKDCLLSNASDLLSEVDGLIHKIKARRGHRPDGAETWSCRVCGKGSYQPASPPTGFQHGPVMMAQISGGAITDTRAFSISVCDHCGHAELFKAYRD